MRVSIEYEDGIVKELELNLPAGIGKNDRCSLCIKSWRVAKNHATIELRNYGPVLLDHGSLGGTFVNNTRVSEYGPLKVGDQILIGPCQITIISITAKHEYDESNIGVANLIDSIKSSSIPNNITEAVTESVNLRARLHADLLNMLDLRRRDIGSLSDDELRQEAGIMLEEIIDADSSFPSYICKKSIVKEVVNEAVGLGLLEPLLADNNISEIMVNKHNEIFIESHGKISRYNGSFINEEAVKGIIDRIVSPLGRRVDESSPMVDARLKDGSRVNAIIPPLSIKGSSLTIRKFPTKRPTMDGLLAVGALDSNMAAFLEACVRLRKNIVVSGGTGSGKTTLLNVLSNCIPPDERIITIEDAAELKLSHEHLVSLESRPSNIEGKGQVTIRELVRNALRMRPDRIVVGECRGGEAFDMLAAMNTGHDGSLTTLHANNAREALARLETMVLMAGMDLPLVAVRDHISSSIDIIVQQARLSAGHRVVTSIVQITGQESGRVQLQELFQYRFDPVPQFIGTGILPEGMSMQEMNMTIEQFSQCCFAKHNTTNWLI